MSTPESQEESKRVLTDEEFEEFLMERDELYRRAKTDPSIKLPVIKGIKDMIEFDRMTEQTRRRR